MDAIIKDAFCRFPTTCADCPFYLRLMDKHYCMAPNPQEKLLPLDDILPKKERHPNCRMRPIHGAVLYETDDAERRLT